MARGKPKSVIFDVAEKEACMGNGVLHNEPKSTGPRMVKRKSDSQIPQAQHGKNSQPSQHDKRVRLSGSGKQREKTEDAGVPLCGYLKDLADAMGRALDRRIGFRFAIVVAGMMLARGRRTAPGCAPSLWESCR